MRKLCRCRGTEYFLDGVRAYVAAMSSARAWLTRFPHPRWPIASGTPRRARIRWPPWCVPGSWIVSPMSSEAEGRAKGHRPDPTERPCPARARPHGQRDRRRAHHHPGRTDLPAGGLGNPRDAGLPGLASRDDTRRSRSRRWNPVKALRLDGLPNAAQVAYESRRLVVLLLALNTRPTTSPRVSGRAPGHSSTEERIVRVCLVNTDDDEANTGSRTLTRARSRTLPTSSATAATSADSTGNAARKRLCPTCHQPSPWTELAHKTSPSCRGRWGIIDRHDQDHDLRPEH